MLKKKLRESGYVWKSPNHIGQKMAKGFCMFEPPLLNSAKTCNFTLKIEDSSMVNGGRWKVHHNFRPGIFSCSFFFHLNDIGLKLVGSENKKVKKSLNILLVSFPC